MTVTGRHRQHTTLDFQTARFETTTVTIGLRQVTEPVRVSLIRQQLGLNDSTVILEGRLLEPRRRPEALKAGHEAPLNWGGRGGLARLEPYQGAITDAWRDKYGDRLLMTWRSDETP